MAKYICSPIIPDQLTENDIVIGVDEAGMGPLFGDVYVSAVCLSTDGFGHYSDDIKIKDIKDSKKFTSSKKLNTIADNIIQYAPAFSIQHANHIVIDSENILSATHSCMQKAIIDVITQLTSDLTDRDDIQELLNKITVIIDGNKCRTFPLVLDGHVYTMDFPLQTCIKGDSIFKEIGAASILAKRSRDKSIQDICDLEPDLDTKYGLLKNKGYCTKIHMDGIREHGRSPYHRKSFRIKGIDV